MKSIIAVILFASVGEAAVQPIAPSAFSGSSSISFDGLATGTEANGLVVGGLSFGVIVGGISTNGQVIVDAGPGVTNNVNPPNLVSVGNLPDLLLTVDLPSLSTQFGYGFALLATGTVANGTSIELFNGATSVGSLSYFANPDPMFPGGFAGIESTIPFDRAQLTFSQTATSFAVDNFLFGQSRVPENSSTFDVLAIAFIVLAALRKHWSTLQLG